MRDNGADAFAVDLKALVAAAHRVVPLLEGGIGLYRAWFDLSRGTLPGFLAYHFEDHPITPSQSR